MRCEALNSEVGHSRYNSYTDLRCNGDGSLSVVQAVSSSLATGQHPVTSSVSQLTATPTTYKNGFKLTNLSTSGSPIFYGAAGVSATTGDEIPAGQSVSFPLADASLIYVITASGTATVSFAGLP